jgi:ABC-type nickel/cobalt efflux system permease component RcnA
MLPVWLQYFQAVALILIPFIGAYIAWQQMRIAWSKLQFDLYEKRFAIYAAARKLISEAVSHGNVSDASLRAYMLGAADVFLLNNELSRYLDELAKRMGSDATVESDHEHPHRLSLHAVHVLTPRLSNGGTSHPPTSIDRQRFSGLRGKIPT